MEKIFIVTDSTADMPKTLVEALGVTVVPLKVHFKEETYLDGVTITADEFYKKLQESEELPTTSQPSPMDFVEAYKSLVDGNEGAKIISIHISAALSGTVQSALLAKNMVEEEGIDVTVIDSKKASYAIGHIIVGIAEAVKEGKGLTEVKQLAYELIKKVEVYFLVDTLTYLQKGGRIGKASSLIGSLLNIKPILSLNDNGEVYPVDKARGRNKAISRAIELISENAGGKKLKVGILHSASLEDAKKLEQRIIESFEVQDIILSDIGPVVGTHVGPGTLAVTTILVD